MSTTGSSIQDLLPIPDNTAPVTNPDKKEVAHSLSDEPTLSHALATTELEEKGAAQQDHDEEVVNLGWNEPKENIENPLVGGIDNEDLGFLFGDSTSKPIISRRLNILLPEAWISMSPKRRSSHQTS